MAKLYVLLAQTVQARLNCIISGNSEWEDKHNDRIHTLISNYMPSGGGIDNGTKIDKSASTGNKLVFDVSFHHMDDSGCYDGWTEHTITVLPSLTSGINVVVKGENRNDIRSYLADVYYDALTTDR